MAGWPNCTPNAPWLFRRGCTGEGRRFRGASVGSAFRLLSTRQDGVPGRQTGDPAKLARALITISSREPPPRRFIAGADAIATAEQVVATLQQQIDAFRGLSTSLAFDEAEGAGRATD